MSTNSDKIICWRGGDGDTAPVKCICDDKFGWPNFCTDEHGNHEKMYENRHYLLKEDAWKSIIRSVKAGISLAAGSVKNAKEELAKAQERASEMVVEYGQVRDNKDNPFRNEM